MDRFDDMKTIINRIKKNTSPARYAALTETLPMPDGAVRSLATEITGKLLAQTEALHEKHPYVAGSGRPLRAVYDSRGVISIEAYRLGELLTYSEKTLRALKARLRIEEAS